MLTSQGPHPARIAIVSDYATKEEQSKARAIEGHTERKIQEFFSQQESRLRISVSECFKTTYVRKFIQGAEAKAIGTRKKAIRQALESGPWNDLLLEDLKRAKPNVILALGELALQGTTGNYGIRKYRGSILPIKKQWLEHFPNAKVVPTLHPRTSMVDYKSRVYVTLDYEKALRYRNKLEPFKEDMLIWVCRNSQQLNDYWSRVRKQEIPFYTCDIETYCGYITYVGFCFDGREGVSIPLLDHTVQPIEKALLWKTCDAILRSKYKLVNQNVKYDIHWLEKWGFNPSVPAGDTMLAGHTLYPELPKNLGFYTSIYTDFPYHKDEGKDFDPSRDPDQLGRYNAKDCIVTWRIYEQMVKDLKETKTYHFYNSVVMPLFHVYRKIDNRGICVDDEKRKKLLYKYNCIAAKHQHYLDLAAGRPINVDSYVQVGEFIYEDLKVPKHTKKTESGRTNYVTNAQVLEDIYVQQLGRSNPKSQLLKLIIGLSKVYKTIEFLTTLRVHPDGKLRTTYRLEGTESGRTSGSEHLDFDIRQVKEVLKTKSKEYLKTFKYGHSFQTLPKHGYDDLEEFEGELGKDVLSIFVPSRGYVFVEGDGSQAEARAVAVLARDFDTLDLMNKKDFKRNDQGLKDDLHTTTAMWTTAKPFEDITRFDREKYGKRPRHAGNYDQGPSGLALVIHKSIPECRTILTKFHANVPKLRSVYHRSVVDFVRKYGCLTTPFGRRRDFFDKPSDKLFKVAYSYIPQSTISDHYKLCTLPLEDRFDEVEARIIVEKHDSLMAEVRKDKVEEWATAFKEVSEKPIDFSEGSLKRDFKLVIPSEVLYSEDCWTEDMKEI